jgi:pimeloyl-ACP methyl ester carboxylesterase
VRNLYFRPDWEKVITAVVDAMLRRPELNPKRIALLGISQGSYWAARALAVEHRFAAAVVVPGIWDIAEPWLAALLQPMQALLKAKEKTHFDLYMQKAIASTARTRGSLRFRMRPFGMTSSYDVFEALRAYNLDDVVGQIRCPTLVTTSEGEHFAVTDQAQKLYDALNCPKTMVHFTHEQGADQHCEVAAPEYRDYAIYNWLDKTLV